MSTFTFNIGADATPRYAIISTISNSCYSEKVISVNGSVEDLHVKITSIGNVGTVIAVDEVITADKTYSLLVTGSNETTSEQGKILMVIRDGSSTGPILGNISLVRNHSGNYC